MKLVFCVPPAQQRIGGLDSAIESLRSALGERGVEVFDDIPANAGTDTLVHFHGLWQPAHSRLAQACRTRGIPYVVSPHGMLEPWAWRHKWWKKWPYFHFVERNYLAGARALLATATPEARRLAEFLPRQRIEALPLGLTSQTGPDYHAARVRLGWKPTDRILLYLSRIHVKKGLDLLLRALSTLPTPPQNTRLVVVGDGDPDYLRSLHRFATENAAALPAVDWIGAVWGDARWPYFQGADLFCLPTHSENFGLAVLEACQVGTPALTTTETPWADQLSSERGYIARPTVESLREGLAAYFSAPVWSAERRCALSEWAHNAYDWPNLAPRYCAFYESVIHPG